MSSSEGIELTVRGSLSFTAAIFIGVLMIIHSWKIYGAHNNDNTLPTPYKGVNCYQRMVATLFAPNWLHGYTLLALFNSFALCMCSFINFAAPTAFHCLTYVKFASMLYHWSKFWLYAVFISRIQSSFTNSAYAYNDNWLFAFLVLNVVFFAGVTVGDAVAVEQKLRVIDGVTYCDALQRFFGTAIVGVADLFFSVVCGYLFIKPLIKMSQKQKKMSLNTMRSVSETEPKSPRSATNTQTHTSDNDSNKPEITVKSEETISAISSQTDLVTSKKSEQSSTQSTKKEKKAAKPRKKSTLRRDGGDEMMYIARKIGILTVVAIVTTFVAMVGITLTGTVSLVRIDQMINSACVILMFGFYDHWYGRCCSPLHNAVKNSKCTCC